MDHWLILKTKTLNLIDVNYAFFRSFLRCTPIVAEAPPSVAS